MENVQKWNMSNVCVIHVVELYYAFEDNIVYSFFLHVKVICCVILVDLICAVIAIIYSFLTMATLQMINNTATNELDMLYAISLLSESFVQFDQFVITHMIDLRKTIVPITICHSY